MLDCKGPIQSHHHLRKDSCGCDTHCIRHGTPRDAVQHTHAHTLPATATCCHILAVNGKSHTLKIIGMCVQLWYAPHAQPMMQERSLYQATLALGSTSHGLASMSAVVGRCRLPVQHTNAFTGAGSSTGTSAGLQNVKSARHWHRLCEAHQGSKTGCSNASSPAVPHAAQQLSPCSIVGSFNPHAYIPEQHPTI